MIGTRVLMGLGEACFFVGATTMATDLAPEARRGEAVSYWSVALWGGLAFGPVLGELLLNGSNYDLVWYVAGGLALTAAAVAFGTRETHVRDEHETRGRLIAPEAIRPGIILAAVLMGITGFSIFLPLYAPDVGVDDVGPLFLVYGIVVVFVRIFGAKLPDRLGPIRSGTIAIGASAVGLGLLAVWQSTAGLVVATIVVAVGLVVPLPVDAAARPARRARAPARIRGRYVQRVLRLRQWRIGHRARRHRRGVELRRARSGRRRRWRRSHWCCCAADSRAIATERRRPSPSVGTASVEPTSLP